MASKADAGPPDSRGPGSAAPSSISRRRAAARSRSGAAYTRRREEIVAGAARAFRLKGYLATTLSDIADAVGVDRASLYFYVSSKEEIFDEIVTDLVKSNVADIEAIAHSDDPPAAKLRELVVFVMSAYAEHYPFLYVYLQENLGSVTAERQEWAAELREVNHRYERAVIGLLEEGIAAGSMRPVEDVRVVAYGLMGMISWTHRWFTPDRAPLDAAAIGNAYADIMLEGLISEPVTESPPLPRAGLPAEVQELVDRFAAADVPTYDRLTVAQARAQLEGVVRLQRRPPELDRVDDLVADTEAGPLPVRVYRSGPDPAPVVVYLHGGGWVLGSIAAADRPCRSLAAESGCVIVSVDYRRAPETPFPGAFQDAVAAVRWAAEKFGTDRLVVAGDSAGGNLAAAVSAELRGTGLVDAQVLIYPVLAPASTTDFASYRARAHGPLMTRGELDWFWGHYLRRPADATDPRAAPLHDPDLAGLPDTTVVVAALDPLRDEGIAYAAAVGAAGAEVRVVEYDGMPHGFWWMDRALPKAADLTTTLGPVLRGDPSWDGTIQR